MTTKKSELPRRDFIKLSAAAAAGITLAPSCSFSTANVSSLMKRKFGKIDFNVTTLGLGGQASIQWTPEGVDPVAIILKAFDAGINYFDTSNLYAKSQLHYGEAFRRLNLVPGRKGYDKKLREKIFLTTKSHLRWGKGGYPEIENVRNNTNGDHGEGVIGDLKRSLSQMFGDGKGYYPEGAYVNMILIHSLSRKAEVDVLYKGLENKLDPEDNFGALVAIRDYRDGTNYTGLNPKHEKLLHHIGFSGHHSAPVMMDMIRRDKYGILDGMLVAINPNDRLYLNMQYNVIPVAKAKNMAVIGMKVFADGAMYSKPAQWSREPSHVVTTVGSEILPSKPLIQYALSTPGIHTVITGIGHIDEDPLKCQLTQNIKAAQVAPEELNEKERETIEATTRNVKEGKTNYFQREGNGLSAPENVRIEGNVLCWDTAVAGDAPVVKYEIYEEAEKTGEVEHKPQVSLEPFKYEGVRKGKKYRVAAVDRSGRTAESDGITAL